MIEVHNSLAHREYLSDLFDNKFKKIELIKTSRIYMEDDEHQDDVLYIHERCSPDNEGVSWVKFNDLGSMNIDGKNISYPSGSYEFIKYDGEYDVVRETVNKQYVGCIVGKNHILLSAELNVFYIDGIKSLLDRVDLDMNGEDMLIMLKVKRIVDRGYNNQMIDAKDRIERNNSTIQDNIRNIADLQKDTVQQNVRLHGLEKLTVKDTTQKDMDRLFTSEYLDHVEYRDNGAIDLITVPLKLSIWDIGQWCIRYVHGEQPHFLRVTPPVEHNVYISPIEYEDDLEELLYDATYTHPHITSQGSPCIGNALDLVNRFWEGDLLEGFNFSIQFLMSYNGADPYISLEPYLKSIGYLNDGVKLFKKFSIVNISNGVLYTGEHRYREEWEIVTPEMLSAQGITGKRNFNPEEYLKEHTSYEDYDSSWSEYIGEKSWRDRAERVSEWSYSR
jgi:hypothetical protein